MNISISMDKDMFVINLEYEDPAKMARMIYNLFSASSVSFKKIVDAIGLYEDVKEELREIYSNEEPVVAADEVLNGKT